MTGSTLSDRAAVFGSPINPEKTSQWVVFPKGWRVDEFRRGVFHLYTGPKRFVSVREGTIIIRVTDGEERTFKKGDIFEAVDLPRVRDGSTSRKMEWCYCSRTTHERDNRTPTMNAGFELPGPASTVPQHADEVIDSQARAPRPGGR